MLFVKPKTIYDPCALVARGQTCQHCNRAFGGNHGVTPLFAILCARMPNDNCRPTWGQHKLLLEDGRPYLSIMEQIGQLAGLVEERGHDGYTEAMDSIRLLVARLSCRPAELVKPCEEWFLPETGKKPAEKRKKSGKKPATEPRP